MTEKYVKRTAAPIKRFITFLTTVYAKPQRRVRLRHILFLARTMERHAQQLYHSMAQWTQNPKVKYLASRLSAEEGMHYSKINTMLLHWKTLEPSEKDIAQLDQFGICTGDFYPEPPSTDSTPQEQLKWLLLVEKKKVMFYTALERRLIEQYNDYTRAGFYSTSEEARTLWKSDHLHRMIDEEHRHIGMIQALLEQKEVCESL